MPVPLEPRGQTTHDVLSGWGSPLLGVLQEIVVMVEVIIKTDNHNHNFILVV